ncbi:hypothetical protein ACWPMX_13635 [Tsuneonella sp. HG094]
MNLADKIIGAHVDRVCFGLAHFQLGLTKGDESFTLSSSADILLEDGGSDFRDQAAPTGLTALVGKYVKGFDLSDAPRAGQLRFEEGNVVRVAWPDVICDTLFIIHVDGSDEWDAVG